MLVNIIKKYTQNITKYDINKYALSNNHKLKDREIDIIYSELHNNIDSLINNTDYEINKIKDKLEPTTYLKIIELINFYKEKYKDYL
ncbi:MAG: hypothetical protein J6G98_04150 [Bacilli bacterium]|nr:hypothetical protein [Bacilli bacterium]